MLTHSPKTVSEYIELTYFASTEPTGSTNYGDQMLELLSALVGRLSTGVLKENDIDTIALLFAGIREAFIGAGKHRTLCYETANVLLLLAGRKANADRRDSLLELATCFFALCDGKGREKLAKQDEFFRNATNLHMEFNSSEHCALAIGIVKGDESPEKILGYGMNAELDDCIMTQYVAISLLRRGEMSPEQRRAFIMLFEEWFQGEMVVLDNATTYQLLLSPWVPLAVKVAALAHLVSTHDVCDQIVNAFGLCYGEIDLRSEFSAALLDNLHPTVHEFVDYILDTGDE